MFGYLLYIILCIREWNRARVRNRRLHKFLKTCINNTSLLDFYQLFEKRSTLFEQNIVDLHSQVNRNHVDFIKHVETQYESVKLQINDIQCTLDENECKNFNYVEKYKNHYSNIQMDFNDKELINNVEQLFNRYENALLHNIETCENTTQEIISLQSQLHETAVKQHRLLDIILKKINKSKPININNKLLIIVK